jgi:hypothetical protein
LPGNCWFSNSREGFKITYVFDVRARVDCDDVSMLDTKVMADDSVHARTTIIKVVIREYDQNGVLPLLSLDQDCVTTE